MADLNAMRRVSGRREPEEAPQADPVEIDAERRQRVLDHLKVLAGKIEQLADDQVSKKSSIEDRWLEDLRQYHGRYDRDTEADLKTSRKSRIYANLTRQKTHAWESRLSDMLFPTTDDKNWGIHPTPVPDIADSAQREVSVAQGMVDSANAALRQGDAAGAQQAATEAQSHADAARQAQAIMDAAKLRAESMEAEMDDQLREANYNIRCREAIHDSCKLGTGIMKGPVLASSARRRWVREKAEGIEAGAGRHTMATVEDPRPAYVRVDPWNYFPDMAARTVAEAEFHFERHPMTKAEVRRLAREPGFDADAVRDLLNEEPRHGLPPYWTAMQDISGQAQQSPENRYIVWEYYGPIEHVDMVALLQAAGDVEMLDEIEEDPLDEHLVCLWLCQGHILKVRPYPLESSDSLYSAFPFERDDTCIFGFGVPSLMRDSQSAVNGAWRMMLNNAGISAGPQIEIDRSQIEPMDGVWDLTPFKLWSRAKSALTSQQPAFTVHHIQSNQEALDRIIDRARQFVDDETSMPLIAQGEQASHITQTAQGMSMLMNAANVVFRRVVKNFDDDMTVPNIQRLYDWNMQFSTKEHIKGDYEVDARGSSVLLVREVQAQNLMAMALQFTAHPVLGPLTKAAELYRKIVQAHHLPADEIVMTEDEIEREQSQQGEEAPDPELLKIQAQQRIAEMEAQTRLKVAEMNYQAAMMSLAEKHNMHLEDLRARLEDKRMERDSKERVVAVEAAMAARTGRSAGGHI